MSQLDISDDFSALPQHHQVTHSEKLIITASSLGTVFEWYDFYLYGLLATIISAQFFSGVNETTGFIFALGEIAHHAAPEALGLVVTRFRHAAQNAQHQRNGMFADGIGVAALRASEPNASGAQHITVILIRAGAGGLHKAQTG